MDIPIINDYKLSFIKRRLILTLFGNLKIFSKLPFYVRFLQVIVYILSPTLCGIFLYLIHWNLMNYWSASLANGMLVTMVMLLLKLVSFFVQKKNVVTEELQTNFSDEEILEFDSLFGPRTWSYFIPLRRFAINSISHAFIVGIVASFSTFYLDVSSKYNYFNQPVSIWLFRISALFTLASGTWPLITAGSPEPAVFNHLSHYDLQELSRPAHMLTCILIHIFSRTNPNLEWLFYVDCFGHAMFMICPLLWLLGVLPPVDAYFLWMLECWHVLGLGGSESGSHVRLFSYTLFSTAFVLISSMMPSFSIMTVLCVVFGYLFSLDLGFLTKLCSKTLNNRVFQNNYLFTLFYTVILMLLISFTLPMQLKYFDFYNVEERMNLSKTSFVLSYADGARYPAIYEVANLYFNLGWLILAIWLFVLALNHLQKPFIFRIFKNCLRITERKFFFRYRFLFEIFLRAGVGVLSVIFLQLMTGINESFFPNIKWSSFRNRFIVTLSSFFVYRQIWQNFSQNLLCLSTFYLLLPFIDRHNKLFSVLTLLHIWCLLVRWTFRVWNKLQMIFIISLTSIFDCKQRKIVNFFLVGLNIICSPILLFVCVFCSVFNFPLVAVFTLPFFIPGFPRPSRFWPSPVGYSANRCSDSVYYQQMLPGVSKAFHSRLFSCSSVQTGDVFLIRWENRMFWIQILEMGFLYHSYSFKGLEIEETSCHTVEALKLDSIFSRAFDQAHSSDFFNRFPLNLCTPLFRFKSRAYSDAKNVLTGVIDSQDTLDIVKKFFCKVFLFLLVDFSACSSNKKKEIELSEPVLAEFMKNDKNELRKSNQNMPIKSELTEYDILFNKSSISKSRNFERKPSSKNDEKVYERKFAEENGSSSNFDENVARSPKSESTGSIFCRRHSEISVKSRDPSRQAWVEELEVDSWSSNDDPLETSTKETAQATINSSNPKTYIYSTKKSDDYLPNQNLYGIIPKAKTLTKIGSFSNPEPFHTQIFPFKPLPRNKFEQSSDISFKCPLSESLYPPKSWMESISDLDKNSHFYENSFPNNWFKFLLKESLNKAKTTKKSFITAMNKPTKNISSKMKEEKLTRNISSEMENPISDKNVKNLLSDENLKIIYKNLTLTAYDYLFGEERKIFTPKLAVKIFNGLFVGSRKITNLDKEFSDLILKAYRIALKLSLDHVLVEPIEVFEELKSAITDYDENWYIGVDSDVRWQESILREVPHLFSIAYDDSKKVCTSRLLTLTDADLNVGKLHQETIRSVWSSLSTELLYLTNDDDERYSIQAHSFIFRNLSVQAADPPLGYPIFSSEALYLGIGRILLKGDNITLIQNTQPWDTNIG